MSLNLDKFKNRIIDNYLIEMGLFIKTVLLDIYCF